MSQNKVIKSVSFNKTNSDDEMILKHVVRRNFSGYVKKLILQDIRERETQKPLTSQNEAPQEQTKESAADRLERMKKERGTKPAPGPLMKAQIGSKTFNRQGY